MGAMIPVATPGRTRPAGSGGILSDGAEAFRASIEGTTGETRTMFDELIAWAEWLALLPNVRRFTYSGMVAVQLMFLSVPPTRTWTSLSG